MFTEETWVNVYYSDTLIVKDSQLHGKKLSEFSVVSNVSGLTIEDWFIAN